MKNVIVASTTTGAGKTSVLVGLAGALGAKPGYLKPLGDRLLYRKKRLWDNDALTLTDLWGLTTNPEDITIGFEHAKLRFMYDEDSLRAKLGTMLERASEGRDAVFIEAGGPLSFGASVRLDALSLARYLGGDLILVMAGADDVVMDEICYWRRYLSDPSDGGTALTGVIVNQVDDVEEFRSLHQNDIEAAGIPLLGVIPNRPELMRRPVKHLAERLLARVVAGESGLDQFIEHVFIGAMSVTAALGEPSFEKENKLIITSGDRSDMILLAIESRASAVLLTNNQIPPNNILSRASQEKVPLLMVPWDTYTTVRKVEQVEALLQPGDRARAESLAAMAKEFIQYRG